MDSFEKEKLKKFFDSDFDKNTLRSIDYEKSNYLYGKLLLVGVLIIIGLVTIRIFLFPGIQDTKMKTELDSIQNELSIKTKEIQSIKEKNIADKSNMAIFEKERAGYKEFETTLIDIFSQKDLIKWKSTNLSINILGKDLNTTIESIQKLLEKMPNENTGTLIKITKIGDDSTSIETTIKEAGELKFWQYYFANKEISARKGKFATVNDLIK